MKKVADIWYVEFGELTERCGILDITVKMGISRGAKNWQYIPDPDDRRRRLIRYESLADKYKLIVRQAICKGLEPEEFYSQKTQVLLSERYSLEELLEQACKSEYLRYTGLYKVTSGSDRQRKMTIQSLARAAAVIETIGAYYEGLDWRDYGPIEKAVAWLDSEYDFYFPKGCQYLPKSGIRLKEAVMQRFFGRKETGKPRENNPLPITEVIRLPRQGNDNRDKFSNDRELLSWVVQARMDNRNWTARDIARKIAQVCQITGKKAPSESWVSQLLCEPKIQQLTTGRWGHEGGKAAIYQHYISVNRAMYAGDCWQIDATRFNFIEHKTPDGKSTQFLFIVAIRDVYSGYIVGVDFGVTENRWTYINALRMAARVTGYLPHTLVHDRFPGHMSDEMQIVLGKMEAKGVKLVCTHKATGKAALERWFDTLQTVFESQSKYYYGQGIRSTRDYAHRAPAYLDKLRKEARAEGFDFDQAWQEAWQCVDSYNQTRVGYYSKKHPDLKLSPSQLHEQSEKPHVYGLELWDEAALFWLEKVVTISRNQILITVHKQDHIYQIFDHKLLYSYSKKKISVRYDETDLSQIMLFVPESDVFITELKETSKVTLYGPDGNHDHLAAKQAQIKRFEKEKQADLSEILEDTRDITFLLAGRASKEEQIEAESQATKILYTQMGAKTAGPKPKALKTEEIEIDASKYAQNQY
ncbi:hypothetical protein ACFPMF_01870 [Larkinella bovis]|uniref:Integrase catalytic domain-containing protein n=1 Tax=Larkinella bovis TaxID=683041 RepID=A0ABW0I3W6_9BACT